MKVNAKPSDNGTGPAPLTASGNHMSSAHETDARGSKLFRLIEWLGSARRINAGINDEMATLKFEVEVLRWANKELRAENANLRPDAEYGRQQKANRAKYDAKRGRANG